MKTIKILSFVFLAMIVLASCNTEYAEPKITLDAPTGIVIDFSNQDSQLIAFDVTFEAEAKIDEIVLERYDFTGEDFTNPLTIMVGDQEDWKGLTSFEYVFEQTINKTDFDGGITKIEFEFMLKDAEGETVYKTYTISQVEAYTVTFVVKDGNNNVIDDAVVTFGEVTNTAGDYIYTYVTPETYNFTVTKAGFVAVTGEIEVNEDVTENVILLQNLGAWSDNMVLRHTSQANAYYATQGDAQPVLNEIGVVFPTSGWTNANMLKIVKTEGCEGWVLVEDITEITKYHQLANIFAEGDVINELEFTVPDEGFKATFSEKYFVSKVGNEYMLVHAKDGRRNANTGNVLVFSYKTKVSE